MSKVEIEHIERGVEVSHRTAGRFWTPDDLGDDLGLWLTAQDYETLTLSDVDSDGTDEASKWEDKSSYEQHVEQTIESYRPEYEESAINGFPALRFDGADDFLGASESGDHVHIFAVAHVLGLPTVLFSVDGERGDYAFNDGDQTDTMYTWDSDADGNTEWNAAGWLDPNIWEWDAPANKAYETATALSVESDGSDDTHDGLQGPTYIGYEYYWDFGYTDGYIGEVVTTRRQLSIDEQEKMQGYLAHHYDLTDKLPSDHPYKNSAPTL